MLSGVGSSSLKDMKSPRAGFLGHQPNYGFRCVLANKRSLLSQSLIFGEHNLLACAWISKGEIKHEVLRAEIEPSGC